MLVRSNVGGTKSWNQDVVYITQFWAIYVWIMDKIEEKKIEMVKNDNLLFIG